MVGYLLAGFEGDAACVGEEGVMSLVRQKIINRINGQGCVSWDFALSPTGLWKMASFDAPRI